MAGRPGQRRQLSWLEDHFDLLLKARGIAPAVKQFRAIPDRRFRWDFAWPEERVLVEIQGGLWVGGRHARAGGIEADYEKLNLATVHGYASLYFTSSVLRYQSAGAMEMLRLLLIQRSPGQGSLGGYDAERTRRNE